MTRAEAISILSSEALLSINTIEEIRRVLQDTIDEDYNIDRSDYWHSSTAQCEGWSSSGC